MPVILTEGGFMDPATDFSALRNDAKLKAQGEGITDGLAVYFKLIPKSVSPQLQKKEGRSCINHHQKRFSIQRKLFCSSSKVKNTANCPTNGARSWLTAHLWTQMR